MKIILAIICIMFVSAQSWAASARAVIGLHNNKFESKSSAGFDAKSGLQFGVLAQIPFSEGGLGLTTGGLYTTRGGTATTSGTTANVDIVYIDVPLYLSSQVGDEIAVYGGLLFSMKMSESCSVGGSSCTLSSPKSSLMGFGVGTAIKLMPNIGMDIYINKGSGDVWGDSTGGGKDPFGVGVLFAYHFD